MRGAATVPVAVSAALIVVLSGCAAPAIEADDGRNVSLVSDDQARAWVVPQGGEFWRPGSASVRPGGVVTGADLDLSAVVERARHALEASDDGGTYQVRARRYTARFDGQALRFAPDPPVAGGREAHEDELTVRSTRIAVGKRELYQGTGPVSWTVLGNSAQMLLAREPELVEHQEARRDGVELSWVLRDRPVGGDLEIEVEVSGLVHAASTETGMHFADARGIARARIGPAVLVDAHGRRWAVPAKLVDGRIRWRVAAQTLEQAEPPMAIDPTVGPEFGMDEPLFDDGALYYQDDAAIGSNGTDYLVVWADERGLAGPRVYGARVTSAGTVLDLGGIPLAPGGEVQSLPAVASNGTDYFVAWQQSPGGEWSLRGARVSADGEVLDPGGILLASAGPQLETHHRSSVASNGTDYAVAWERTIYGEPYEVRVVRVSAAGNIADAEPLVLASSNLGLEAKLASNGTDYFAIWWSHATDDIRGVRVPAAGPVVDGISMIASGLPYIWTPEIASDGSDYLVVWAISSVGGDIVGTRITPSGTVLDGAGITLSSGAVATPTVAWTGSEYLIVWKECPTSETCTAVDDGDVVANRVSSAGTVLDGTGFVVSAAATGEHNPALAATGTGALAVWTHDDPYSSKDIHGARIEAGTVLDAGGFLISSGPNKQLSPSVASNGTDYLVVWIDERDGSDVYGVRVSGSGTVLTPGSIRMSDVASATAVQVASNGADYLVVWRDERDPPGIYARRVSALGELLDGPGFAVASGGSAPSVGSNGSDYLITWSQAGLYGTAVSADGVVGYPDGLLLSSCIRAGRSDIASDGSGYLVVWEDCFTSSIEYDENILSGRRLSATGAPLDANPFLIDDGSPLDPSVAFGSGGYLVTWLPGPVLGGGIHATAISVDGTVLGDMPLDIFAGHKLESNGTDYLLALTQIPPPPDSDSLSDILATRLTVEAMIVDDPPVAITGRQPGRQAAAQPAYNPSTDDYLVVYTSDFRIMARLLNFDCGNGVLDPGEACDDGDEIDGDGCSAACQLEVALEPEAVGPGIKSEAESGCGCRATPAASLGNLGLAIVLLCSLRRRLRQRQHRPAGRSNQSRTSY